MSKIHATDTVTYMCIHVHVHCIHTHTHTHTQRETALRRREERVCKQQQQHDVHARRKYSQFTGTQEPPRGEVSGRESKGGEWEGGEGRRVNP